MKIKGTESISDFQHAKQLNYYYLFSFGGRNIFPLKNQCSLSHLLVLSCLKNSNQEMSHACNMISYNHSAKVKRRNGLSKTDSNILSLSKSIRRLGKTNEACFQIKVNHGLYL